MAVRLSGDIRNFPGAYVPLYRHDDGAEVAAAMPAFNERGLVPPKLPLLLNSPVPVSSGESSGEEG